jgi:protein-disulfide isomerase
VLVTIRKQTTRGRPVVAAAVVAATVAALLAGCPQNKTAVDLRHAMRLGPEGAPFEVVEFSDFQCPFCKRAAMELNRIHRSKPGRVKIYFKHFPLDYHPEAVNAALAAEAARLQGKFWEMHDLLFEYAAELHPEIYPAMAEKIGLDVARFEKDMASFEVRNRVAADVAEGDAIGVDAVPYFLLNRVPFRGSYHDLVEELESHGGSR